MTSSAKPSPMVALKREIVPRGGVVPRRDTGLHCRSDSFAGGVVPAEREWAFSYVEGKARMGLSAGKVREQSATLERWRSGAGPRIARGELMRSSTAPVLSLGVAVASSAACEKDEPSPSGLPTVLDALMAGLQIDIEAVPAALEDKLTTELETDLSVAKAPTLHDPKAALKLLTDASPQ